MSLPALLRVVDPRRSMLGEGEGSLAGQDNDRRFSDDAEDTEGFTQGARRRTVAISAAIGQGVK